MRILLLSVMFLVSLSVGCAQRGNELATVRDLLALAKEDRVAGRVRVTVNGALEAGIKEGVYFDSPGTRVDADLTVHVKDVTEGAEGQ